MSERCHLQLLWCKNHNITFLFFNLCLYHNTHCQIRYCKFHLTILRRQQKQSAPKVTSEKQIRIRRLTVTVVFLNSPYRGMTTSVPKNPNQQLAKCVSQAKRSTTRAAGLRADRSAWGFLSLAWTSCWAGKVRLALQLHLPSLPLFLSPLISLCV